MAVRLYYTEDLDPDEVIEGFHRVRWDRTSKKMGGVRAQKWQRTIDPNAAGAGYRCLGCGYIFPQHEVSGAVITCPECESTSSFRRRGPHRDG